MADPVEVKVETPVVETPVKEVTPTEEATLLGDANETLTPEQIKTAEESKSKEEALKNETPEQKTARETKEAADIKANSIPEKYEIKAPEGTELDAKTLEVLSPVFKDLKLTNIGVQKLVDTYAPIMKAQVEAQVEAQQKVAMDLWTKETEGWKTESLKQLGSEAPKELAFAAKVINKIGTQYDNADGTKGNKLRDILEETRVGNHPEITKLFIQIGKMISADSFVDPTKEISIGGGDLYNHPDSKANLK